jgi:hypothetical protein
MGSALSVLEQEASAIVAARRMRIRVFMVLFDDNRDPDMSPIALQ